MGKQTVRSRIGFAAILLAASAIESQELAAQVAVADVAANRDRAIALAFSPDGTHLASGGEQGIRLWNPRTGELVRTFEPREMVHCIAFAADSKTLAAAGRDRTIEMWDVGTGKQKHTLEGHIGRTIAVSFSADGAIVATGSTKKLANDNQKWLGDIKVWDASTSELKRSIEQDGMILAIAISPDSALLAVAVSCVESGFRGVRIWQLNSGRLRHSLSFDDGNALSVAFSPDGQLVASGGTVEIWGAEVKQIGELRIWNVQSGKLEKTLRHRTGSHFRSIDFSPNGRQIVTGSSGQRKGFQLPNGAFGLKVASETMLWEVDSGKLIWSAEGELGEVFAIRFSPDGSMIASCDSDGLTLSDPNSGTTQRILTSERRRRN